MTQLVIIGIYLGLLLALGLFSSRLFRGTSQDYMLASHSIGPVLLLMSLFGTTMTGFALVGASFYLRWKKDYPWPVVLFFAAGGVVVMIAGFVVSSRARGKLADVID